MKLKSLDRKKDRDTKLNLIPIMDAVFIFIFFLLMSAQFIEIYEIGSDAPAVTTTDSIKDKRPPLNLTMVIENNTVHIKTGLNERTIASFPMQQDKYDVQGIREKIIEIKKANIEERSIIFRPVGEVSYERLVELMDAVRKIDKSQAPLVSENTQGQVIQTWELFNNIIFETLI